MNLLDYYTSVTHAQWPILMEMRQVGIRVDRPRLSAMRTQVASDRSSAEADLEHTIGWRPNTKSYLDMGKFFAQFNLEWQSDRELRTPTGRPKSNEEALKKHLYKTEDPNAQRALALILEVNQRRTFESSFLQLVPDPSDYYHPAYFPTTVTGRLASKGDEAGGPQLQNIPSYVKPIFIPDPGHVFIQFDYKQAELIVVAYAAEDLLLISGIEQKKDMHQVRGCVVYRGWDAQTLPPDDMLATILDVCPTCKQSGVKKCKHSERQTTKQAGYALVYLMGLHKFLRLQAMDGWFPTYSEAKRIQSRILSPAIRRWQQSVWDELLATNCLRNPCGMVREFYGRLDNDMWRDGLSWIAQRCVAHITTKAMLAVHDYVAPMEARIVTQTHDSILISAREDLVPEIVGEIPELSAVPIEIKGRRMAIGQDTSVGDNWGELKEV